MHFQQPQNEQIRPSELYSLLKIFRQFDGRINYFLLNYCSQLKELERQKACDSVNNITEKINEIKDEISEKLNNFDYRVFFVSLIEKLSLIKEPHFDNEKSCFNSDQLNKMLTDLISFLEPLKLISRNGHYRQLINGIIQTANSKIKTINKNQPNYIQELINEISFCESSFRFDEIEKLKTCSDEILKHDLTNEILKNLRDYLTKLNNKELNVVKSFLFKLLSELKLREATLGAKQDQNVYEIHVNVNKAHMYFVISDLLQTISDITTSENVFKILKIVPPSKDKTVNDDSIRNQILTKILDDCKQQYRIDMNVINTQLSGYSIKI